MQVVSRTARLCPLLGASVGEREIEHRFSARLACWCRRGVECRTSFRKFPCVGGGNNAMRLQLGGRASCKPSKHIGVSIISFAVMLRCEKLFRAGRAFGAGGNSRGAQARNRGRGFN